MVDTHSDTTAEIDPAHFRKVLGHFCSGVTIISAFDGRKPIGFTCQSFLSLSLDPALIAFSASKTSTTYPRIREIGKFVVNVLASDQDEVSNAFAKSGTDKWAGVHWKPGQILGHPVIDDALATLECEIAEETECGDHFLVVARVRHLEAASELKPLLFFQGSYHRLEGQGANHD
ncbi:flavin reductase family protein [Streptomyces lanatus]|uniref:Flavin reductase family protein n=1 Tax=Streptomyces lanatus TaxID=66900 RepID=A0ABV1Y6L6_9ACTN|nr:flavin reductase family protein [Streptomyces lanatus]GHH30361.1 monooxygenase [Streptomyces lanatus]